MGFGTIFATIAMVVIIGISSYLFMTGALFTMDRLSNSLKRINEIHDTRLKTALEIKTTVVQTDGGHSIVAVSLKNTGSSKILNEDFTHIDLFLYYQNDTGTENITIYRRIPYNHTSSNSSLLQDNEWTVVRISPDFINPGNFDPDEQMDIAIRVYPAIANGSTSWLKVVMPNGIFDACYF